MGKKSRMKQNYLNIRKGPELNFIVGEHQNEFEQTIMDMYLESTDGFWGCVPSLELTFGQSIPSRFLLAGFLGAVTGDPSTYTKEITGQFQNVLEEEVYATTELMHLGTQYANGAEVGMKCFRAATLDVAQVLDYHNMFYAFTVSTTPAGPNGTGIQAARNIPWEQVW